MNIKVLPFVPERIINTIPIIISKLAEIIDTYNFSYIIKKLIRKCNLLKQKF